MTIPIPIEAEHRERVEPTAFQQRLLVAPADLDIVLWGGKGGGKTFGAALLVLQHVERHGRNARVLIVRKTHSALRDLWDTLRYLFRTAYGSSVRFNDGETLIFPPNGAYVECNQFETARDYEKAQGRNFSLLWVDEVGQYPTAEVPDLLRSNLRARPGVPVRSILSANPAGAGHTWLLERFGTRAEPWTIGRDPKTEREFLLAPSTLEDNPHIDRQAYLLQLRGACAGDEALLRAWTMGDWMAIKGLYFSDSLSDVNAVASDWPYDFWKRRDSGEWRLFLAYDHGTVRPCAALVMARSYGGWAPDGNYFPGGSYVVLDEYVPHDRNDLNRGLDLRVDVIADEVKDLARRWQISPSGIADAAIFGRHGVASIADEFRRQGVYFQPSAKGPRVAGWQTMRVLLNNAKEFGKPCLKISRRCDYVWRTLPTAPRDPRRPDDIDSDSADHALDAIRYGIATSHGFAFRTF